MSQSSTCSEMLRASSRPITAARCPPPKVGGTAGGRISGALHNGNAGSPTRAAEPEYLTDALRRAGALGTGRVLDVVVESSKATILSRIVRLR